MIVGKTTLPEMGILPTTESRRFGADPQPVDPGPHPGRLERRLRGGGRRRDGADRPRQRRRRLDPDPGGLLRAGRAQGGARPRLGRARRRARASSATDGVLTRTVADTAAVLDVLAGYEPGDANWAPPSPAAYAELARASPAAGCGSAWRSTRRSTAPSSTRSARRRARRRARCSSRSGTRSRRSAPPWSEPRPAARLHARVRAVGLDADAASAAGSPGASRPRTTSSRSPGRCGSRRATQDTLTLPGAQAGSSGSPARSSTFLAPYDAVLTPALAQRPVAIGEIHGRGPRPVGQLPALRVLHAVHRDRQRHRACRRSRCRSITATTGCRPAVQLIGPPAREEVLLALATQLEQALPWADRRARLTLATWASLRPRARRSSASAPPRGAPRRPSRARTPSAPPAARPRPRWRTPSGPATARPASSVRRVERRSGCPTIGRRRRSERRRDLDDLAVGERLRARRARSARRRLAPPSGRRGARRSRSRPRPRPRSAETRHRPEPGIGITGSSDIRCSSVRYGSLGRVDDRGREHRVRERGLDHRPLGDRLGAHQSGAAAGRGAERREEHEPLHAGALGRSAPAARWRRRRAPRSSRPAGRGSPRRGARRCPRRAARGGTRGGRRGRRARSGPGRARPRAAADRGPGSVPASLSRSAAAAARVRPSRWRPSAAAPPARLLGAPALAVECEPLR